MPDILEQLESLRAREFRVAMATLVAARGGSPRPLGAKLFVGLRGDLLGSVSIGGCVDARVAEHGQRLLGENRSERVTVTVDDTEARELGLTCGAEFDLLIEPIELRDPDQAVDAYETATRLSRSGQTAYVVTTATAPGQRPRRVVVTDLADVPTDAFFVERIAPPDVLVIVGASDVAATLARLARILGLRVVVVDGREQYATKERFAAADEILVGMPSELVRPFLRHGTFLVLAAHDYKYELPILRDALRSPVRYVGMLSGRKRAESVRTVLREEGLSDADIARLHAPIGLDIGGREPEEIALSIAAQLIAVRENKSVARRSEDAAIPAAPLARSSA
ncbi:MAG: XdhC family protein [Betaproteobacteria bacterium]|nr:MAG: XdhC family protein [Betaproteobacteria bacterium]